MDKRKIFFRADAGAAIGYGHFIRSLALADMLKEDFDCTFFTQTPTDYQIREASKVCRLESLPADDTRFGLFLERLCGDEIVVLDNYFYTTEYQQAIKDKGCRLVCIDDMHDKHYVADVVINHGIDKASLLDVEPYTRLCIGLEWALLRRPFLEAAERGTLHRKADRIEKVAVCFGGSDAMDFTGRFVARLLQTSVREITAVVGDGYKPKDSLAHDTRVNYCSRLSAEEMAEVFTNADAVFCSASSVCLEALACGAKVAAGWYVDNQKGFYDYLLSKNCIVGLGFMGENILPWDERALNSLDGEGIDGTIAPRIVALFQDLEKGYFLREARTSDVDLIFEWANDPEVRRQSFHSEPIAYSTHTAWFSSALQAQDMRIYIMVSEGRPIGQVRLNLKADGTAEIGYLIAPAYRGKGWGKRIIELVERQARDITGVRQMEAWVKASNVPSCKVFERCGYSVRRMDAEKCIFVRDL